MFTENIYISNNRRVATIVLVVSMIAFGTVFLVTGMIINTVFGAETLIPQTYNETLEITKNTTESTEGHQINSYVENVKQDICKTLVNATEYQECLKL